MRAQVNGYDPSPSCARFEAGGRSGAGRHAVHRTAELSGSPPWARRVFCFRTAFWVLHLGTLSTCHTKCSADGGTGRCAAEACTDSFARLAVRGAGLRGRQRQAEKAWLQHSGGAAAC